MNDYDRARQLAVEAETAGIDLVAYVHARAPRLLDSPDTHQKDAQIMFQLTRPLVAKEKRSA
jgi:hypothetical protein